MGLKFRDKSKGKSNKYANIIAREGAYQKVLLKVQKGIRKEQRLKSEER